MEPYTEAGAAADGNAIYAPPDIESTPRSDGSTLLRSVDPLGEHPVSVLHSLRRWARTEPDHPLAAERTDDRTWRTLTYGEADVAARAIGQALLTRGLGPDRPLMVLSGNSLDHLMIALGAMTAGVPVVPTSVAYSLQSQDHRRLREIADLTRPGAVFADDSARFSHALDAVGDVPSIVSRGPRAGTEALADLVGTAPGRQVEEAFDAITPAAVAKILFTSGSTGSPKGVLTTHGMLSANQQMIRQVWPFLTRERPVIVDWLPWSHTFGGNHNVGMMLTSGGTVYIDDGRPDPALFARTVTNLADVRPTICFNVPAGFARLVPALESDPEFASRFFSRLRVLFNAAAALPDTLRQRLIDVAVETTGRSVPITGSWGLTETAPAVTNAHFEFTDARSIGVPLPGAEVLLHPTEDAYEIRVRGPMVTPGYFARPDLTAEAFDADGFYRTGDAVEPADPDDPNKGLLFDRRIAEDFKLSTGTFVRVGAVRVSLLSALPVLSDAVITGENRDFVCALAWVDVAEARRVLGDEPASEGAMYVSQELFDHVGAALGAHNRSAGSAARVQRLVLMCHPAGFDDGEITDKGYVNQRRVLQNRASLVDLMYEEPVAAGVVVADPA